MPCKNVGSSWSQPCFSPPQIRCHFPTHWALFHAGASDDVVLSVWNNLPLTFPTFPTVKSPGTVLNRFLQHPQIEEIFPSSVELCHFGNTPIMVIVTVCLVRSRVSVHPCFAGCYCIICFVLSTGEQSPERFWGQRLREP